jgi:NADH:ubiquinone oxidoreductase subunit 6 (subunit J)
VFLSPELSTVNQILFGVIATMGVLSALGTVLARNLVHAALFLVAFFFLIACQFVLLEAEFLAAVQVLVYIGAVAIILMFGIMLTRNIQGDDTTIVSRGGFLAGGLVAAGLLTVLIFGIINEEGRSGRPAWKSVTNRPAIYPASARVSEAQAAAVNNMGRAVGVDLLTRYLVAFEMAGVLLTAALVGAIALAVQEGSISDDPADRVKSKQNAEQIIADEADSLLTSSRA